MGALVPLLQVRDLVVEFPPARWRGRSFRALHGVSIDVHAGETVGVVGESGSGKTTLGRAVLGLAPVTAGTITFDGNDISRLPRRARRALAADVQVVFQDPFSSLNPAMTIHDILVEPLGGQPDGDQRVRSLLDDVGLPADTGTRFARELSGGQRQRVAIARALAMRPRLIICDEPVSALDPSTQAQVINLLVEIQQRTGVAYLFIAHNLAVVRHVSDRVAVMSRGEIVERGEARRVTTSPEHPYTQRLLLAATVPDPVRQAERRAARQRLS